MAYLLELTKQQAKNVPQGQTHHGYNKAGQLTSERTRLIL
jgi:hypothetical protein